MEAAKSIEGLITDDLQKVRVSLTASGEGSWWAHLLVLAGSIGAATLAIQGLAQEIREGKTPFTRGVAAILDEGDGRIVSLSTRDEEINISVDQMISSPPPVGVKPVDWVMSRNGNAQESDNGPRDIETIKDNMKPYGELIRTENQADIDPTLDKFDALIDAHGKAQEDEANEAKLAQDRRQMWANDGRIELNPEFAPNNAGTSLSPTTIDGTVEIPEEGFTVVQGNQRFRLMGRVGPLPIKSGEHVRLYGYVRMPLEVGSFNHPITATAIERQSAEYLKDPRATGDLGDD